MQISKTDLESMYNSMKNKDVAEKLKISIPTLIKTVKKAGIKIKGKGKKTHLEKLQVII